MKLSGSHQIDAPRQAVWDALQDPAVLARTLPGCTSLEVIGPDEYAATVTAGVASVRGTYRGKVRLVEQEEPETYRLFAQGAGGPGTIQADARVRLEEDGGSTVLRYDADAVVGGMIGGVGQRMLTGVAKKTAGEFFDAVERDLAGVPVERVPAEVGAEAAPDTEREGAPAVGQVFAGAPARGGPAPEGRLIELAAALVLGAAIALVGVLVGRRSARRSWR